VHASPDGVRGFGRAGAPEPQCVLYASRTLTVPQRFPRASHPGSSMRRCATTGRSMAVRTMLPSKKEGDWSGGVQRWTPIIRARKSWNHERSGSDPAPATEDAAAAAARPRCAATHDRPAAADTRTQSRAAASASQLGLGASAVRVLVINSGKSPGEAG
jgi:hypothetical protein